MIKQKTLRKVIQATGVGLHSGQKVLLTLRPAPINTGIVFRRVDLSPVVEIPASYQYVSDTTLCTSLQYQGVKVATVEHLLSAFAGLGIDNVYVDVNAPELPIVDGSAAPFVVLMQSAGIREQSAPKKFLRILKPVVIEDGDKCVRFSPYEGYKVTFTIEFDHPVFHRKPKTLAFDFGKDSYTKCISRARTFGFLAQYEKLREMGLAKGGGLDNAVVVDDYRIINEDGLRFHGEFVAHKVLDAIGDLNLLGCGLIGAFDGEKSGHEMNNRLLRALMAQSDAFEYTTLDYQSHPFAGLSSQVLGDVVEA